MYLRLQFLKIIPDILNVGLAIFLSNVVAPGAVICLQQEQCTVENCYDRIYVNAKIIHYNYFDTFS